MSPNLQLPGRTIDVYDEGILLQAAIDRIDFAGAGVTGAIWGSGVVETIPGGGAGGVAVDYGNGSDGNVTLAVNTILSRDMFYDNLLINAGVNLITKGYRVFVKGTLTNNGTITMAGGSGSPGAGAAGGAGGIAQTLGSNPYPDLGIGYNGGNGGAGLLGGGGNGSSGSPSFNANLPGVMGGAGGVGGAGAAQGAGGTAGYRMYKPFHTLNNQLPSIRLSPSGFVADAIYGGTGGGGGGGGDGDGAAMGGGAGGGGASGGCVMIFCDTLNNLGTITVAGGVGGAGAPGTGGNANGGSGGAGGGGGLLYIVYNTLTALGVVTVAGGAGGAGGAGSGTGIAGQVGNAGNLGTLLRYDATVGAWV